MKKNVDLLGHNFLHRKHYQVQLLFASQEYVQM